MTTETPLVKIIRDIRHALYDLKADGCTGFDGTVQQVAALCDLESATGGATAQSESLAAICADLGDCTRCPLCRARTRIVFGEGDPQAQLVFVGEGPGFDEDQSGRPFVGAAGQLLTKIITAMSLDRERVYICNIVKCRPPNNRNPEPDEIRQCLPFLKRQLRAIHPRVVCALGNVAARTLLETDTPISRLRGRFHAVMDIPLMPTYHPAFLLRNPDKKRDVWDDVRQIMNRLV